MPVRLKSLELQGYKTFAARTTFEFAESVTAIVGPNGSGKSNIADALRWVLGEQSYSLLRGKKTEDMIFAGSEQKSRASMASASVIFDNDDGWLPIDFSEVAIARRAYRDGQNEYLLNGQRVRLKDISELLSESGLAERTYTIIGQGLVDAALALKAEERRRLFEEAAGIGLHRSRREEAERRLETTQRNLERVQDILAELRPRLRSLERQAGRAEEYEQIKADLRQVLREWYGYHWHRAQTELREAREAAQKQEITLESTRQSQANYFQKQKNLRNQIQTLRNALTDYHRQLAELHQEREDMSRQVAIVIARLRALAEQRDTLHSDMMIAEETIGIEQARLEQVEEEVTRLEDELLEAKAHMDRARESLNARIAEREQAEAAIQAKRQELSQLYTRRFQIAARITERKNHLDQLRLDLVDLEQTIENSYQHNLQLSGSLKEKENSFKRAQEERVEVENSFKSHLNQLSETESTRRQVAERLSDHQAEFTRLRTQQEVLEQAERSLEGYTRGAKALIQAARQNELHGAQGALSKILVVPVHLESAIAAALGEFLDSILLEGDADPEKALMILNHQSARGALLPIANLMSPNPVELDGHHPEDVIGVASKLIECPSGLRTVVDLLLGQVILVKDRAAAKRFLRQARETRASQDSILNLKIVTLQGEMFYGGGQIVAGNEGKATTLSRARDIREIDESLSNMKKKGATLEGQLRELDGEISKLRSKSSELEELLNEKIRNEDIRENELRKESTALEQAQRELAWREERRRTFQKELVEGEKDITALSNEIHYIDSKISEFEKDLKIREAQLDDLSLEEFQNMLSHWETRSAVIDKALEDAKSRSKDRQTAYGNAQGLFSTFERRLKDMEIEQGVLEGEHINLRQSEVEIGNRIDELQSLIKPTEEKLSEAELEQNRLLDSESETQRELNQAEHQNAQAKINLARQQEALETLRRRIEDDFGLVEFEYAEDMSGPTPLPFEGLVEKLPLIRRLSPEVEETLKRQRAHLRRMGPINPEARKEFQEVKQRFQFLTDQMTDLTKAESDIRQVISELDSLMEREFYKTFEAVAGEFRQIFSRVFGGGSAKLVLTDPDDLTNTGIDIEARLPGRREQGLSLLSGGERSLTATALVFSLLRVSPTPFCVMDEVDAMLDEANVGRFRDLLRELSDTTQFIIITHNRNTVQVADVIYGVTMGRDSTSQVISLKLDEVSQVVA